MSFAQGKVGARVIPNILGPYLSIQDASSLAQTSRRRAIDGILQAKVQSILAMLDSVPINTDDYSDFEPRSRIGVDEDSTVTLREYIYNFTLEQSFSYFSRDYEQQDARNRLQRQKYKLLFLIIKMLYRNKIINISLDQYPDPPMLVPEGFSKLDFVIKLMIEEEVELPFLMPEHLNLSLWKTVRLVLKLAAGIMPDTTASQRIREDIDREEEEEEMGGAGAGGGGAGAGARRGGSSSGGGKRPRSESLEGGKTFFTFY